MQGFLECGSRKIDLAVFVPTSKAEAHKKNEHLTPNNMHNLSNVRRHKSEMGVLSDYPHFFSLTKEGSTTGPFIYACRHSENGEFTISTQEGVFCQFGPNFLGTLRVNLLGTRFELVNHGMDPKQMRELPKDFIPAQMIM